jgi:hypothetical protein
MKINWQNRERQSNLPFVLIDFATLPISERFTTAPMKRPERWKRGKFATRSKRRKVLNGNELRQIERQPDEPNFHHSQVQTVIPELRRKS